MRRVLAVFALMGLLVLVPAPTYADLDCKESPTPDMPGQGLASFFAPAPGELPPEEDPFAEGSTTTIYEQYGFAGLRWNTYDLGCGPDAARNPDAVIGNAVSNWTMNVPVSMASLTASITQVSFEPTFLSVFDPLLTKVSTALHETLFASWVPIVLGALGLALIVKARGMALASTAGAIAWAVFVVIVAAALFRWPVAAGQFADETVTASLGGVVRGLNGDKGLDPATAVASNVQESILYTAWLSGELGSTDSATAKKYGPELFKAQTLSWREAHLVETDPEKGKELIQAKKDAYGDLAETIKDEDPAAYEHLIGKRSDTRVGYALLATLGTVFALPFLLISALMLLGSFIIVRLAVMLFPAFATLGVFPAARGSVVGIGRTVGAALINSVIFGVGAAVTITVIGVILDPATKIPAWLTLVLLPLFSLVMWLALKPFRRLTSMAGFRANAFGEGASLGNGARDLRRMVKKAAVGAIGSYTGNVAAGAALSATDKDKDDSPPDRAEARVDPVSQTERFRVPVMTPALEAGPTSTPAPEPDPSTPRPPSGPAGHHGTVWLPPDDTVPQRTSESVPLPPTEPEWFDGEEVYPIYRPAPERSDGLPGDESHDAA